VAARRRWTVEARNGSVLGVAVALVLGAVAPAAATLIYFLAGGGEEAPPEADSGAGAALLPTGLAVWW
jgi:hypothetical protein